MCASFFLCCYLARALRQFADKRSICRSTIFKRAGREEWKQNAVLGEEACVRSEHVRISGSIICGIWVGESRRD
jgi:hypothetical protein